MRKLLISFTALIIPFASQASDNTQDVTFSNAVQIPGGSLKAGAYTFGLEDRLADRAVVRITSAQNASEHYLLLAVPNPKMPVASSDRLVYFKAGGESQRVLKAWNCADCRAPLEFVYPKLEAVKITDDTTEPVMAVDPAYDKLPGNLSQEDMKVVTLWLLAPERITADNAGQGVKAAKYSPDASQSTGTDTDATSAPSTPAVAATPSPAASAPTAVSAPSTPAETARASSSGTTDQAARHTRHRLPETASDAYLFALCGFGSLVAALALRVRRRYVA